MRDLAVPSSGDPQRHRGSRPQPRQHPTVPMTSALDGHLHEVASDEIESGHRGGVYVAVCGRPVRPRPADEPAGPGCLACTAVVLADNYPAPAAADDGPRTHWRQHHHWMARRCRSAAASTATPITRT